MQIIKITYHILAIFTIILSLKWFKKKSKLKEDVIIIYTILIYNFFDLFIWSLPNIKANEQIGALAYDILFPLFIICITLLQKYKKQLTYIVISITLISQQNLKWCMQISIPGYYKIALSLLACSTLFYIIFKNIRKVRFQVFLLLLIAGIPFLDTFLNAAYFKYIPINMSTLNVFLSAYLGYVGFISIIILYYYGKRIHKN